MRGMPLSACRWINRNISRRPRVVKDRRRPGVRPRRRDGSLLTVAGGENSPVAVPGEAEKVESHGMQAIDADRDDQKHRGENGGQAAVEDAPGGREQSCP